MISYLIFPNMDGITCKTTRGIVFLFPFFQNSPWAVGPDPIYSSGGSYLMSSKLSEDACSGCESSSFDIFLFYWNVQVRQEVRGDALRRQPLRHSRWKHLRG